jgi:hypothetical protein
MYEKVKRLDPLNLEAEEGLVRLGGVSVRGAES